MNTRSVLPLLALVAPLVFAFGSHFAGAHEAEAKSEPTAPTPNVPAQASPVPKDLNLILITVDTLRTDVGFMGYPKAVTPNIDRIAKNAVIFDRAYSMSSYTGKSLGPMVLGKYSSETLRDGGHLDKYPAANTFLAERLRDAGVFTMGASSHWYLAPHSGMTQGMQAWDLSPRPPAGQAAEDNTITSPKMSDAGLRLLSEHAAKHPRFFMWLHYMDPHSKYQPHPEAPGFDESGKNRTAKAAYDAEVWFTDKHIGRLFDYVASQPWGARTAIVFSADHGEAFGENGLYRHGHELWESLVHVPLFVYAPGLTPHHVPVKRGHIDLVPTILDLMGAPQPPAGELTGKSLMPDLVNADARYNERDIYLDMPWGPYNEMRRGALLGPTPGMKVIQFAPGRFKVFDLAKDPGEKEPLASDDARYQPTLDAFGKLRATLKELPPRR